MDEMEQPPRSSLHPLPPDPAINALGVGPACTDAESPALSVIIPAYNAQRFIAETLTSALQQAHADRIQFIVIDDASNDATFEKISSVQQAWPNHRIEVIKHQENLGISATRNEALEQVKTPYIGFLDADDLWAPQFTKTIMPLIARGEADIIEFDVRKVGPTGKTLRHMKLLNEHSAGLRELDRAERLEFARVYQCFSWSRIYRRELWNELRFPTQRELYEDCAVIPVIYARAHTICRIADELYFYREHMQSATHSITPRSIRCVALSAEEALDHYASDGYSDYWMAIFHQAFSLACIQTARVGTGFAEAVSVIDALAAHYHAFMELHVCAPHQKSSPFSSLHQAQWIAMDRRYFLVKQALKRAFGLERRPRFLSFMR
jgi:glycosyltransferase involved in cell wall biosynthesis